MALYLSFAVALFALAFLRSAGSIDRRYENILVLCITVFAWAVSVLRWQTGTDWDIYFSMFENLRSLEAAGRQSWWGPGYAYLAVLVHAVGGGYTLFLMLVATLLFATKYTLLRATTTAPLVAVFILFCMNFFDIYFVRQNVSTIFVWLFAYAMYRRIWVTALLAGMVGILFHTSSVIALALVVVAGSVSWRTLWLGIIAMALLVFLVSRIGGFSQVMQLVGYGMYSEGGVELKAGVLSTTTRSYIKLLFWVGVAWAAWRYFIPGRDDHADGEWLDYCLKCMVGFVAAAMLLLPFAEIFSRIPDYGRPFLAVIVSCYAFRLPRLATGGAVYLAVLGLFFVQLGYLYSSYEGVYYPYRSVLWVP